MNISCYPLNFSSSVSTEQLFSYFSELPWAMWLDSCGNDHIDSRFDILVWQPHTTLVTTGQETKITQIHYQGIHCQGQQQSGQTSVDDPLALLARAQQQTVNQQGVSEALATSKLPFKGGAVGLFGYDLGRRFEKISTKAQRDISLPDMAVGIYLQAILFDHHSNQYWLICPVEQQERLSKQLAHLVTSKITTTASFSLSASWQANMTKAEYQQKFAQVQQALLEGDCYQVNLAQRFQASYQGDEFNAYKKLRQKNNAPFSAFLRFEQHSILSLSPERFIQVNQGKVQTKPIKGTMPRSEHPEIDQQNALTLKNSSKDRAENLMIVDLLRNDLSKNCQPGSVKVPKLFDIESFPAVHHLVSTIEGQLEHNKTAIDLLRGAFPGGSITGAPKISAMEVIEALEPQRRSLYCGSIGYLSSCGNMDTSITIRTIICQQSGKDQEDHKLYCWAGGGLVADSNVDAEYQETFDKVNKILPILNHV